MTPIELPAVTRVHTDHGSHIEPEIDETWPEARKLAFRAAVVAHDTGLRITIHDQAALDAHGRPQPGRYAITISGAAIISTSGMTYRDAWTYLNGVATGARAAQGNTE